MAININLTDNLLPLSPVFLDFLHGFLDKKEFDVTWHDQLSEELVFNQESVLKNAHSVAKTVLNHPVGKRAVLHVYDLLIAILTGQVPKLKSYHDRYRFVSVIGAPRHGGSYLTKQIFRAIGMDPNAAPDSLAHDGFPEAAPFTIVPKVNTHMLLMHNMAEYLTMVDMFFDKAKRVDGQIVVPKKLTKAAYHGAVFSRLFGPNAGYIITLRHPVAACISTYEKTGGFPDDGKFKMRGKIEEWIRRDNVFNGENDQIVMSKPYFDVYLRYWELYHYNLALTGLPNNRHVQIVAYGQDRMMSLAQTFFDRLGSSEKPELFQVFDKRDRHPEWYPKAEQSIRRVAAVWETVGWKFPVEALMEAW